MTILHFFGFGENTQAKRREVAEFIKKQLWELPEHQCVQGQSIRDYTILVGHPESTSHTLVAHAGVPFIRVESTDQQDADLVTEWLAKIPGRLTIVKAPLLQAFIQ